MAAMNDENLQFGIWQMWSFWERGKPAQFWDWEFHRDIIHCILMIKGFAFGFLLIALHGFAAMVLHDVKEIK